MKRRAAGYGRYLSVDLAHLYLFRGARRVLHDLNWRIRPGQRWVLQAANGAGKTQLLKLIAGDVWPQPRAESRRWYRWRGELNTEPYAVKEQIAYLGAERQDRYQHYGWNHRVTAVVGTGIQRSDAPVRLLSEAERSRVLQLLRRLGVAGLARRRFLELSEGERRLVLLARALAWRPALLLLDEPLSGLDAPNRARFLKVLDRLSHTALPWIYASHRADEVPVAATHQARLEHGGLSVGRWHPRRPHPPARPPARLASSAQSATSSALIELRHASVWRAGRAVLRRLTLHIGSGQIWVVHGGNGSGKSTLLATLLGTQSVAADGSVWRRHLQPGMPLHLFQAQVGFVAPELQASLPRHLTVIEGVVAALRGGFHLDGAMAAAERRAALRALAQVGARGWARRRLGELSYGQARRVLFARALARHPDIVLLDEPYTGLDLPARRRLRSLIERWATGGRTLVMATHHRDDWPRGATHELELATGRPLYCGPVRRAAAKHDPVPR